MKNYKYSLIFLIIVVLSILSSGFCCAREVEVPLPGLGDDADLLDYIRYLFNFGMTIAGILALIALIMGGVRYLTSAGNPDAMGDAKKRIIGGILGLVILLSSYLILTTINPELKIVYVVPLEEIPGIHLTCIKWPNVVDIGRQDDVYSRDDLEDRLGVDVVAKIRYECPKIFNPDTGNLEAKGADLIIYLYAVSGWDGLYSIKRLRCGEDTDIQGFGDISWKYYYEIPGIYFYSKSDNCDDPTPFAVDFIRPPKFFGASTDFAGAIAKSVRIVNDIDKNLAYGAILGRSWPQNIKVNLNSSNSRCVKIHPQLYTFFGTTTETLPITALLLYKLNPNEINAGGGNEVVLYTHTHQKGGEYRIKDKDIRPFYESDLSDLDVDYSTAEEVIEQEKVFCPNFYGAVNAGGNRLSSLQCIGSIHIDGDYAVLVCDDTVAEIGDWDSTLVELPYCQIFTEDIENFWAETSIAPKSIFIVRIE